jgi:clan AA aspartic protease
LDVIFRLPGQPDLGIECVVDTGFEGELTLPPAAVAAMRLPYLTQLNAKLADGSAVATPVHVARIIWSGAERAITVLAMGSRPLLGTALLTGYHLEIDFEDGGLVRIDPL